MRTFCAYFEYIFFTICVCLVHFVCFLSTYVGVVKDASTGSPIADANIIISGNEEIGLTTNEKGFFSLHTDEDSVMLSVDAVGYTNFNQSYSANKDDFIYISLDKKSIELLMNKRSRKSTRATRVIRVRVA